MRTFFPLLLPLALISSLAVSAQTAQWLNFTNGDFICDLEFENNLVWIVTKGGLVRYDTLSGESVFYNKSNSGLPFNELRSVAIAPDGKKWFAARIGLISYDGNEWQLHAPPDIWDNPIDQFSAYQVECDASGNIWTTTHNGDLYKYDGVSNWTSYDEDALFGDEVYGLAIDKNDHVWLHRWGTSIFCKFDGVSVTHFDATNTPFPPGSGVNFMTTDTEGEIWVSLNDDYGGIYHYNGNDWMQANTQGYVWVPNAFSVAADKSIYFVNYDGLNHLFPDGSLETSEFSQELWLATDDLYSGNLIKFGSNGKIWLATAKGLFNSDPQDFTRIKTTNSALGKNGIQSLSLAPPQNVLIGWTEKYEDNNWSSAEGLTTCKNGTWQKFSTNNPPGTPHFENIEGSDTGAGSYHWVTKENSLCRLDGNIWNQYENVSDPDAHFGSITADPLVANKVWARTWNSLYKFENGIFEKISFPYNTAYWFDKLVVDSEGNLWTSPANNLHNNLWRLKDGQWTSFDTTVMGLSYFSAWVADIEAGPDGKIGVVTDAGVAVYDGEGDWVAWHYLNTGVTSLYRVNAIAFDGPDKIWLGYFHEGCNAPALNAGPSLTKIEGNVWTNYYFLSSGMPHPNVSDLVADDYHNLWIGTDYGGLGIFNENDIVLGENSPFDPTNQKVMRVDIAPNPARNATTLTFSLTGHSDLSIQISNAEGKIVSTYSQNDVPAGQFTFNWNVESQPAGIYFFNAITNQGSFNGTIVVQK